MNNGLDYVRRSNISWFRGVDRLLDRHAAGEVVLSDDDFWRCLDIASRGRIYADSIRSEIKAIRSAGPA